MAIVHLLMLSGLLCLGVAGEENTRPHIVTIIADDMGWNDVGFHGSNQIPTPNIDALAYNGVILNRHYTQPTCTPSRTAFLTGKYPIRTGMQGFPLMADEPRGLPLHHVILPERLKELGYKTRLVGKWHQGSHRSAYTPTRRGFDSFLGYWNGFIGYFNHTNHESGYRGLDFRRDNCSIWDYEGRYATDVFTEEAESIISSHDTAQPLYLQIAHLAAHTGNPDSQNPLEVPDEAEANRKFSYIDRPERRMFAEIVHQLDLSVGRVVKALAERGLLNNTIIVFLSDNGGQVKGRLFPNFASNWPLRGMKFTAHEGGVRCVAAVWSPLFQHPGRVSSQLFHLTDWLPTLYSAAGGHVTDLGPIDGVDQWASLVAAASDVTAPPRTQILVNIDSVQKLEALIVGKWKLSRGDHEGGVSDGYYGDRGFGPENPGYNTTAILHSEVNRAIHLAHAGLAHNLVAQHRIDEAVIATLRSEAVVGCANMDQVVAEYNTDVPKIRCVDYCLYDLERDPCEVVNLAAYHPMVLESLVGQIERWRKETVPQLNALPDLAANPALHNNTWASWLDEPGSQSVHGCGYVANTNKEWSLHGNVSKFGYYLSLLVALLGAVAAGTIVT